MPMAAVNGTTLHYETAGAGPALVLVHEFGGDLRVWEPQVRYFAKRYRVVTYNSRGYPPSAVPAHVQDYTPELVVEDLRRLLVHLSIDQAHLIGLSMGANVCLNLALQHPAMARSLVLAGCGSGTVDREAFLSQFSRLADGLECRGLEAALERFSAPESRRQMREKNPTAHAAFLDRLKTLAPLGMANVIRGVLVPRKTVFDLESDLINLRVPTLIVVGDQDAWCVEPSLFMRKHLPQAGLLMLPWAGHATPAEDPETFNRHVAEFLDRVDQS